MASSQAVAELPGAAQADPLETLVDAIEQLASARNAQDIASVVRHSARVLSGADGVAVVLRDEDRCHYVDEDAVGPLWKGLKFPMTACISGWAMLNRQTAVIPDIYLDPRIPHDAYRPTFVKSLVMTPVGAGQPVAAIGAYWATKREPTAREIAVLQAIARATATAFENLRLVESLTDAITQRDFLIRELDHRVKNMLASVQSIAAQTARSTRDQRVFAQMFGQRLQALSHAHEVLSKHSWKQASLRELADTALAPFIVPGEPRVFVTGPDIGLKPETAVAMLLGVHELGANAAKYGALSGDHGTVHLSWSVDLAAEPRVLSLDWVERNEQYPFPAVSIRGERA